MTFRRRGWNCPLLELSRAVVKCFTVKMRTTSTRVGITNSETVTQNCNCKNVVLIDIQKIPTLSTQQELSGFTKEIYF